MMYKETLFFTLIILTLFVFILTEKTAAVEEKPEPVLKSRLE